MPKAGSGLHGIQNEGIHTELKTMKTSSISSSAGYCIQEYDVFDICKCNERLYPREKEHTQYIAM